MQIKQVMKTDPRIINSSATIGQAADEMRNFNIGALIVEEGGRMQGIVTDRDIVLRCVARRSDPRQQFVRDCMSRGALTILEDSYIAQASGIMTKYRVRRLIVTNDGINPVGVLTLDHIGRQDGSYHFLQTTLRSLHAVA